MKNWELILLDIVKSKNMDPWNLDTKKLAAAYAKLLRKMSAKGVGVTKGMRTAERVLEEIDQEY